MLIPLWTTDRVRQIPLMLCTLVSINVLVFLATREYPSQALDAMGFVAPERLCDLVEMFRTPAVAATVIAHMFLHGGWLHLLGNLWALAIFGAALELQIGSIRFAILYFVCGVFAALAHAVFCTGPPIPAIGASGAISGVLGCYVALRPNSHVLTLVFWGFGGFLVAVPSVVFLIIWIVIQTDYLHAQLFLDENIGRIAWWAHLGGLVPGFVGGIAIQKVRNRSRKPASSCS